MTPTNPATALLAAAAMAWLVAPETGRAASSLSLEDAVRAAWAHNDALGASRSAAEASRLDAESARDRRLPELHLTARAVRTDEPMAAFGMKLDQGRITAEDFDPARLNDPAAIGGYQIGASLTQVIYAGGKVTAGRRAAEASAAADAQDHARLLQTTAAQVVQSYFASQVSQDGVTYAQDVLAHAAETERFVRARAGDGAALQSEVARAAAFRAQAEADLEAARQRLASARSALALLSGAEAADAQLTTALDSPAAPQPLPADSALTSRPDLVAARFRSEAADAAVRGARGALLPQVFAQASAEAARSSDLAAGTGWTTLMLGVRWDLGMPDSRSLSSAAARRDAAEAMVRWRERQASREIDEARRAIETADARVRSAREAVAASESARALREARHRQGLLPLTEVLDAEAGLAGARALLLRSRLESRLARAELQLALGLPIEGITP